MLPAEDLGRGAEALKTFQKQVDGIFQKFAESAGDTSKVSGYTVTRGAFSGAGDFAEATGLYGEYERAHQHITNLTKMLGLQIEALTIAVQGADIGFDNLEEEQRRRFHEIRTEVNQYNAAAELDRSNDKQSKAGY